MNLLIKSNLVSRVVPAVFLALLGLGATGLHANSSNEPFAIYPSLEAAAADDKTSLYFSLIQSLSGLDSVTGLQLALDQINGDPSFLPGYRLHYVLSDAPVSSQTACTSYCIIYTCSSNAIAGYPIATPELIINIMIRTYNNTTGICIIANV